MNCKKCKTFIPKGSICISCGHDNRPRYEYEEPVTCPHCNAKAKKSHVENCRHSPDNMRKRKAKEKLKSNIGWYPDYKEYRDAFNDKIKAAHYLAEFSGDVSGFTDILVKNVPNRYSHKFILLAKKFFNLTYNKKTMAFRKGSRELPGDVDYRDFSKELFR